MPPFTRWALPRAPHPGMEVGQLDNFSFSLCHQCTHPNILNNRPSPLTPDCQPSVTVESSFDDVCPWFIASLSADTHWYSLSADKCWLTLSVCKYCIQWPTISSLRVCSVVADTFSSLVANQFFYWKCCHLNVWLTFFSPHHVFSNFVSIPKMFMRALPV